MKNSKQDKPLASALLADAAEVLTFADGCDVSDFRRWLLTDPTKPLICIGNGGKHTSYPAFLHEINSGVAKAITPLEFASMSPEAIKSCKILLLSNAGKNMDIGYATKRAMEYNPENTACMTFTDNPEKNQMVRALDPSKVFCFKNSYSDGFISIRTKILTDALLYKAFSGCDKIADKLNTDFHYDYYINGGGEFPDWKQIQHYCVLYGSAGEPVAHDIDSVMAEAGIASAQICDYRNYCHGRFIFGGNHCKSKRHPETDVCMVLLVTPRERKLAEQMRSKVLPANMPIVEISTEMTSSLATIQLLMNTLHFMFDVAENHLGINPNSPSNFSGIDKRVPINSINFKTELKTFGEMKHTED